MIIRRPKRLDILLPTISGLGQILSPPGETGTTEKMDKEKIGHQPGMAAIAVCKKVDEHETMVKASRNLVRRIAARFKPDFYIFQQILERRADRSPIYPDILTTPAKFSCPFPDISEHPPVELADKVGVEQILWLTAQGPGLRLDDIVLFPAIELASAGDMGKKQAIRLVRVYRRRPGRVIIVHGHLPIILSASPESARSLPDQSPFAARSP